MNYKHLTGKSFTDVEDLFDEEEPVDTLDALEVERLHIEAERKKRFKQEGKG